MKRLFFDIETSPNIGYFWRTGYRLRIGPENIIGERKIICASWKWEGEDEVHSITWKKNPKGLKGLMKDDKDKRVVKKIAKLLNEADEVVGHNGDKFDINWVRGRCIQFEIPLTPRIICQDTYKLARRYLNINNYKLDYIAQYLNIGQKLETGGFDLWVETVEGNNEALETMVKYCEQDVLLLEKVWNRMQPYVPAKSHTTGRPSECPECGSENVHIHKRRRTASGYKKIQFKCKDCGKYHSIAESRYNNDKAKKTLEAIS